jgi:hypothetical protein
MIVEGSCHCGQVRYRLDHAPTDINDCQCNHCQKRGVRWAYYHPDQVAVSGETSTYLWGEKSIAFHFCGNCGCSTHWTRAKAGGPRMGVNTRLLPPDLVAGVPVRQSPGPR